MSEFKIEVFQCGKPVSELEALAEVTGGWHARQIVIALTAPGGGQYDRGVVCWIRSQLEGFKDMECHMTYEPREKRIQTADDLGIAVNTSEAPDTELTIECRIPGKDALCQRPIRLKAGNLQTVDA